MRARWILLFIVKDFVSLSYRCNPGRTITARSSIVWCHSFVFGRLIVLVLMARGGFPLVVIRASTSGGSCPWYASVLVGCKVNGCLRSESGLITISTAWWSFGFVGDVTC